MTGYIFADRYGRRGCVSAVFFSGYLIAEIKQVLSTKWMRDGFFFRFHKYHRRANNKNSATVPYEWLEITNNKQY